MIELSLTVEQDPVLDFKSDAVEVPMGKETDPTVPAWAKQPEPPTPPEIGLEKISNQEIYDMFKNIKGV